MAMMGRDIFERLAKERPALSTKEEPSPAQKLLDWLQRWNKNTISTRDIRRRGPGSIRDRKTAVAAADTLVQNGWLEHVEPHQYNMRKWRIIRRPPIVAPRVSESQRS
jgi:hypothetical protein